MDNHAAPASASPLRAFVDGDLGRAFQPSRLKLTLPRHHAGTVSRAGLIGRLRPEIGDLLAVVAPAGYGKTTLLSEWVVADGRPTAWLSLDAADNDAVLLITYLALALDRIEPVDPSAISGLWSQASSSAQALPRLAKLLAGRRTPFTLVLDDVHELVAREALGVLAVLVADLQPGSLLVLAGRQLPLVPYHRLRPTNRVVEAGMRDLALRGADASALLRAAGLDVDQREADVLVERTEGWPAALYLAALSLRARPSGADDALTEFAGDHRLVADYLRDELLDRLEPDVIRFLLGASCLDRLSGTVCDAVLDRTGSEALLRELHRQNLLVIALDDLQEGYRLHHLLRDFLQAELQRCDGAWRAAVHRRASAWFEASSDLDSAVVHAARGGDLPRAQDLLLRHFTAYGGSGGHATVQRTLELVPPEQVAADPLLSIVAAYDRWNAGDGAGASYWLARADDAVVVKHPAGVVGQVPEVGLALLRAGIGRIAAGEMADEARWARQRLDQGDWYWTGVLIEAAAEFMLGDEQAAEELLRAGADGAVAHPFLQALSNAHLAVVQIEQQRWHEATAAARRGRALMTEHRLEGEPSTLLVAALSCLVEARAGNIAEAEADRLLARRHLSRYARIAPWCNLQSRVALAHAALLLSDRVGARTLLDEADGFLGWVPDALKVKDQLADLRRILAGPIGSDSYGPSSLTTAELRVLHYLPTYLTLADIADRLFVSRNTVKTQAIAIYRKLGTSSRGAAVEAAREAGLLDDAFSTGLDARPG